MARRRCKVGSSNQANVSTASPSQNSFLSKFHKFHFKHESISWELMIFHYASVLLWFSCAIIDTVAYSTQLQLQSSKIFFGIKAPLYDVFTVLYASGSATFGVSYEIYPLLLLSVVNFILTCVNCDERQKLIAGFWLFKTGCLMLATQLCYYNFEKLKNYVKSFSQVTKYMMRHAVLFAIAMIFLMAPGLKVVYESSTDECSYHIALCNVIEFYEPLFNKTDPCADGYTQYIVGREELRILRDFLLIHIASYAIYNQSFLAFDWKWSDNRFHYLARLSLLLLFLFMSGSVVTANVTPFDFPKLRIKLIFDIVELCIFLIGIILLLVNFKCEKVRFRPEGDMNPKPDITAFV